MTSRFELGIVACAVVIVSAALMQHASLEIGGIAPNLLLVSLVVFSFFSENFAFYGALALVGLLFGRAAPVVFDPFALVTVGLCLAVFWLQRYTVWPGLVSTGMIVAATTILTYAILAPSFLWHHPAIWLTELLYNVVLGLVLFEAVQFFFRHKIRNG